MASESVKPLPSTDPLAFLYEGQSIGMYRFNFPLGFELPKERVEELKRYREQFDLKTVEVPDGE